MAAGKTKLAARVLLHALDAHEWTQNDLAERSGIVFSSVSHHLTGRRAINDEHLRHYMRPLTPAERQHLLSAWIRDTQDSDVVEDVLNVTENRIHEGVAGWSPGLDPEQKKMLRWWADQIARDPELDQVFRGVTRKAGWPNPLDSSDAALLITDPVGRVVYLNSAFTKLSGYSLSQMRGKKPGEVLHGRETEKHIARNFSRALRERRPFECTITNYHAGGAPYRTHIRCFPVFDSLGALVQFRAVQEKVARDTVRTVEPPSAADATSAVVTEDEPSYRIAAKRKQTGDPLAKAGRQMKQVSGRARKHAQRKSAA